MKQAWVSGVSNISYQKRATFDLF